MFKLFLVLVATNLSAFSEQPKTKMITVDGKIVDVYVSEVRKTYQTIAGTNRVIHLELSSDFIPGDKMTEAVQNLMAKCKAWEAEVKNKLGKKLLFTTCGESISTTKAVSNIIPTNVAMNSKTLDFEWKTRDDFFNSKHMSVIGHRAKGYATIVMSFSELMYQVSTDIKSDRFFISNKFNSNDITNTYKRTQEDLEARIEHWKTKAEKGLNDKFIYTACDSPKDNGDSSELRYDHFLTLRTTCLVYYVE